MLSLERLWRSANGNGVIIKTSLFGNDAIVHFGVFSVNLLCVLCIMYGLDPPLVCCPRMKQQPQT